MAKNKTTSESYSEQTAKNKEFQRAGFFRRLASMVYDALVATAVGMLTGLIFQVFALILFQTQTIDNRGFENYMDYFQSSNSLKMIANAWVIFWVAGFFLWFWKRGGQTLGMRAWRLRIFSTVEEPVTMTRLITRLVGSLFGLGTLLVLFDVKEKQSLQDRLAKTEVLKLSKEANDHKSW